MAHDIAKPLLFESPCAEQRLSVASEHLRSLSQRQGVLIVANSSLAAQWLVARGLSEGPQARFNWHRRSLASLVEELALPGLSASRRTRLVGLGSLGLCTRLVHAQKASGQLGRYRRIAERPGFARALAKTLGELRLSRVAATDLAPRDADLAGLLARYEAMLDELSLADEALTLALASAGARSSQRFAGLPLLLLDLPIAQLAVSELVAALAGQSASVCATVARGDERAETYLRLALGDALVVRRSEPGRARDLERLKARLFAAGTTPDPVASGRGGVEIVSSPGESREAVEVARGILQAAREGVPFDRMAVALRAVENYSAVVEEAFARAAIPAHFADGVRRPLPEGRALLLLLETLRTGLALRPFAEYLSLFVFPRLESEQGLGRSRWERLLREARVGGPRARWQKRLAWLDARLAHACADAHLEPAQRDAKERDRAALQTLTPFVLAILAELEGLSSAPRWGELLTRLERLCDLALAEPEPVRAALAELSPLSEVGPVTLVDVQRVLSARLTSVVARSTGHGVGKVFVATPEELRGRSFDLVFVMGLAEQLFPPRLGEDPLLPDRVRAALSPELSVLEERALHERLLLRICVGAAQKRLVLTFPRLDVEHGRPRVPSFYGLEVLHAVDGALPAFDELARRATPGAAARMGFPAPDEPGVAIDDAEYDLAALGQLLRAPKTKRVGGLRYLLSHPHLARALRFRARRWSLGRFTASDGFVAHDEASRELLAPYRLARRAYSASSIAQLAACPYSFYLQTICGLSASELEPSRDELNPRERGVLMHRAQQGVLSTLRARAELPVTDARLPLAFEILHTQLATLRDEESELRGAGAARSLDDAFSALGHDLEEWLRLSLHDPDWIPSYFELGFGIRAPSEVLDPDSSSAPVSLAKLRLSGIVDLVERRVTCDEQGRAVLRVTDHKSGSPEEKLGIVSGGRSLQPLLYALAVEQLLPGSVVSSGRLYYCTSRGDFQIHPVAIDASARAIFGELAAAVDALLETGFLPAAPRKDACKSCAYLSICGPYEEKERVPVIKAKDMARLAPLFRLRNLP